ncbi:MAG: hypothetical protein HFI90_07060 [Clostridia bacterium]|nr:hypothetical protein [Clostridia bacterium]
MAYNVKNQDDFNKLNPQDKISYLGQNQNSDIYKNELNRVNGILGQDPNDAGALDWYSRVQAANSGVDTNTINNNTYDPTRWQYQNPANGVGIRNTMTNGNGLRMDNSKIEWRDNPNGLGTVTYDGKDFMQANSVNNGTSYAANASDIYRSAIDYWKGTPNEIVDTTSYVSNSGLPFNVDWQNGKVLINGIAGTPAFEIDGNSYMYKNELDNIIAQAMQNNGLQKGADIWQRYEDKYTPMTDALLDKIVNRKEFDYDPEQDIVYRAYRDQYNREGDKSLRDTMGNMTGLTGGFVNSAAVTAGAQAEQQWKDALMDRIPELAQIAYDRYVGDYNMNRNALSDVQNQHAQAFQREYGVNRDNISDLRYNNALDVERNDKNYDRGRQERLDNEENTRYWYEQQKDNNRWQADESYRWAGFNDQSNLNWANFDRENIQYDQLRVDNALTNAQRRGYFLQSEADLLGVPTSADPWNYDKTALRIQNDAQKDYLAYQYALQNRYKSSGSGSGSKKSSGGEYEGDELSAESKKLQNEVDMKLKNTYGIGINQVSAETKAGMIISSNYPDEVKDELLTAMSIPDSVIDQVIKDHQRRSR